jgi:hypothetical protein
MRHRPARHLDAELGVEQPLRLGHHSRAPFRGMRLVVATTAAGTLSQAPSRGPSGTDNAARARSCQRLASAGSPRRSRIIPSALIPST